MPDLKRPYFLLLLDLKGSTRMPARRRGAVFEKVERTLEKWNGELKPAPVLPLSVTYGDEVAGLFHSPAAFADMVIALRETLYPHGAFRFVAAAGKIGRNSKDIRQVGGEIFKIASEALARLKTSGQAGRWLVSHDLVNTTLDTLTDFVFSTVDEMSPYQRRVYKRLAQGMPQVEIARQMRKHPQSVSEAARRGGARRVIAGEQLLRAWTAKTPSSRGPSNPMDLSEIIKND